MKYIYNILGLIFAFFFAACQDNEIVNTDNKPAREGEEILFNATSGYEIDGKAASRTIYSGNSYTGQDGKVYERIEWEEGDVIGIYCGDATNPQSQTANYRVVGFASSDNQEHSAALAKHDADNGLHWGAADKEHVFYAIYPAPTDPDENGTATSLVGKVSLRNNVLTGYVPTTQSPKEIVQDKTFTQDGAELRTATRWAKPDMRYSYMVAATSAYPSSEHVDLEFQPISTALEIDINTETADNDQVVITNITLQSGSGKPLTGNFSCPINADGTPDTDNITVSNTATSLVIQLGAAGVTLKKGEVLRITALLLPNVNVDKDLKITISGDGNFGGDQNGTFSGVTLQAHKKHYITNLPLKAKVTGNLWVGRLDDNILLGGLSIPGAANAFSSVYTGTNSQYYRTQSKSFDELWQMGVRCFELVCERAEGSGTTMTELTDAKTLGAATLRCNNYGLGTTVDQAIESILTELKKTKDDNDHVITKQEFAMVILTYQPGGSIDRDPVLFMQKLMAYYDDKFGDNDAANEVVLYSPTLTVGEARGKLMIVARPSQEGEDDVDVVEDALAGKNYEILTVKGWGSAIDKWDKRGYPTMNFKGADKNGQRYDIRKEKDYPAMEQWIYGDDFVQNNSYAITIGNNRSQYPPYPRADRRTDNRPSKGTINFEYSSDQGFKVWAQEWRRAVKESINIPVRIQTGWNSSRSFDCEFFESYAEKKQDVWDTYQKAISDNARSMVYFNSLDGFYMLTDNYDSFGPYWKGNMGDIQTYAKDINEWFYTTALLQAAANGTGTMGVIIMDYVGEDLGDIPGELLPQIIYNNIERPV